MTVETWVVRFLRPDGSIDEATVEVEPGAVSLEVIAAATPHVERDWRFVWAERAEAQDPTGTQAATRKGLACSRRS